MKNFITYVNYDTAIDDYKATVYRLGILIAICAGQSATIIFGSLKLAGCYPDMSWNVIYFMLTIDTVLLFYGIYLIKTCVKNGVVLPKKERLCKIFLFFYANMQWNLILFFIPSKTFWGFIFFFILLPCFTLDLKITALSAFCHFVSLLASWKVTHVLSLPLTKKQYDADLAVSIICVVLTLLDILVFLFFIKKYLVGSLVYNSDHDALTGLFNRSALLKIPGAISKFNQNILLGVIDVDDFKMYNDKYGHDVGDEVLKKVGHAIKSNFRDNDFVARYGGDEFVVILFNCVFPDEESVVEKFNKINEKLSKGGDIKITLSMGVVSSKSGYDESLIKKADIALYETKEKGKCGCTVYHE